MLYILLYLLYILYIILYTCLSIPSHYPQLHHSLVLNILYLETSGKTLCPLSRLPTTSFIPFQDNQHYYKIIISNYFDHVIKFSLMALHW